MSERDRDAVLLVSVQEDLSVLGLSYVHAFLREKGWRSRLLHVPAFDAARARRAGELAEFARRLDPLYLGVSLMSHEFSRAREVTAFLRDCLPGRPVVWGGVHPTIRPEDAFPHADFACMGEGELAADEIARRLRSGGDLRDVANIARYERGRTVRNAPRAPLDGAALDSLPAPDPAGPDTFLLTGSGRVIEVDRAVGARLARYGGRTYDVQTARGCPFACAYCCNNRFAELYGTRRVRRRSVGRVIDELARAVESRPEIELVNFQDDSFLSHDLSWLEAFAAEYPARVGRPFFARAIPAYATRERLEVLARSGLAWIILGLQSGSDRVCREVYGRPSGRSEFLAAAREANRLGLAVVSDVILDNPFETDAERAETVGAVLAAPRPFFLQMYSLAAYPGTALGERAARELPGWAEDVREKDYLVYEQTPLNSLTRLAAYLPRGTVRRLASLIRREPKGLLARALLSLARAANALVYEPAALLRVLRRSARHSRMGTFDTMRMYVAEALKRYWKQFGRR